MKVLAVLGAVVLVALAAADRASTQPAPPVTINILVNESGVYAEWVGPPARGRHFARLGVSDADDVPVARIESIFAAHGETRIQLPGRIDGLHGGTCYLARLHVYDEIEPGESDYVASTAFTVCADASGVTYSSTPFSLNPPPLSTSHVRLTGDAVIGYTIDWRDNSDDETHFEILVNGDKRATARAAAESESVPMPAFDRVPRDGCYTTIIYVFSVRGRRAGLPGNTQLMLCTQAGAVSLPAIAVTLPDTGGDSPRADDPRIVLTAAMFAAGVLTALAGGIIRRHHDAFRSGRRR